MGEGAFAIVKMRNEGSTGITWAGVRDAKNPTSWRPAPTVKKYPI